MKNILLISAFLLSLFSYSQTKKIFHKSHSGKSKTLFLDGNNNFGPGMAPVRYRTPVSPIKLNYAITQHNEYPLVKLDTINKTMRFFDIKDSLLGCDRNYQEYINHGDVVYDVITNEFYVYQSHFRAKDSDPWQLTNVFVSITDSIESWENQKHVIRSRQHYIRDGNNHRILMSYPRLNNEITSQLKFIVPITLQEPQPILIDKDLEKRDRELLKKENKRVRKLEETPKETNIKEEDIKGAVSNQLPPTQSNYLLRWITLILLVFLLFIFVGVQRIVKDELHKVNQ